LLYVQTSFEFGLSSDWSEYAVTTKQYCCPATASEKVNVVDEPTSMFRA
jgi:hypothetical protein